MPLAVMLQNAVSSMHSTYAFYLICNSLPMRYYERYYKCNKMPEGAKLYKESCAIATDMTKNMNPTASAIDVSLGVCLCYHFMNRIENATEILPKSNYRLFNPFPSRALKRNVTF